MGEIDGEVAFQVAGMCLEGQAPYLALAMVNLLSREYLLGQRIFVLCRDRQVSPVIIIANGNGSRTRCLIASRLIAAFGNGLDEAGI